MFTVQGTQATTAGASTANVLTGNLYERSPVSGFARFSFTAEAAGESRVTVYVGGRVVVPESSVSRQARVPLVPDDVLVMKTPIRRGEQIMVVHRNTGAGTNTLFWRVDIAPRQ